MRPSRYQDGSDWIRTIGISSERLEENEEITGSRAQLEIGFKTTTSRGS